MKKSQLISLLISAVLVLGVFAKVAAKENPQKFEKFTAENPSFTPLTPQAASFVPNEIIISCKKQPDTDVLQTLQEQKDTFSISALNSNSFGKDTLLANTFLLKLSEGTSVFEKINELSQDPYIAFAEPNYIFKPLFVPNDTYFSNQWGLEKIKSEQAWDLSTGNNLVKIAVLDTGIDRTHSDLNGIVSGDTQVISDHGTKIAGIIGALTNNNKGIASLSFGKALLNSIIICENATTCTASLIAQGINRAMTESNKILVLAIGGKVDSTMVKTAIQEAASQGALIIAAAGKDGTTEYRYPAAYPEVLAVAASDENDNRAPSSQYGDWVDVAAPGTFVLSTLPGERYEAVEGTSIAAGFTAGLASLIWSTKPNLSAYQVRSIIQSSADPVSFVKYGRINAQKALAQIVTITPTPVPTTPITPSPTQPTPTPFIPPGCEGKNPLTDPYCALYELLKLPKIFLTYGSAFAVLACISFLIVGAFKYITSGDDPKKLAQARSTLSWASIGLIVALSTYGIIKIVLEILGG